MTLFLYVISSFLLLRFELKRFESLLSRSRKPFSHSFILIKSIYESAIVVSVEPLQAIIVSDHYFRIIIVCNFYMRLMRNYLLESFSTELFKVALNIKISSILFPLDLFLK